jgi:aminoglycoside phosphotransferase (APT) family kinase protein
MVSSRPAAEVLIDRSLVSGLIRSHFPQWSGLALTDIGSHGWDNAVYRLGSDLS